MWFVFLFLRVASCCIYYYNLWGRRQSQQYFFEYFFNYYFIPTTCFVPTDHPHVEYMLVNS
jgi:hypothetical protein